MSDKTHNVLFICTGNSARSIIAEGLMNSLGASRGFRAWSAGSHPRGSVHPLALKTLAAHRIPTDGFRSKGWEEFAQPGSPVLDFVFTVCDNAAGEICPVWPGQPMTAHWGIPDPAAVIGSDTDRRKAFFKAYNQLQHRLSIFVSLPMDKLDRLTLQRRLDEIGRSEA